MQSAIFVGTVEQENTFTLTKTFTCECPKKAVLKATALGIYFAEINGVRVGEDYFAPGWTSYHKTLQVQTYDVTSLLHNGENTIRFTVNDGWFCGSLMWDYRKNCYGKKPAICAELDIDGNVIETDLTWQEAQSPIRQSSFYHGETMDLTAKCAPLTTKEIAFDKSVFVPQVGSGVQNMLRLSVKEVITTPDGDTVYDFGQNMAGVVEIKTPENFNGTLKLEFAEILVHGNFYNVNYRAAKNIDTFTCKGAHTFMPQFTYHGFRYLRLSGGNIPVENITAVARFTNMVQTANFQTCNPCFDRLYQNVLWGQRSNFVDIPTDCPQRDERLGWTGDINAFCVTAAYRNAIGKNFGFC